MSKVDYELEVEKAIVLIYGRKSKKLYKGLTLETQLDRCEKEAKKLFGKNIKIKTFIEDNKSGDDDTREKYNEMKEFIRKNNNCILYSYAVSRLVRDVSEGAKLAKFLYNEKCELYIYEIGKMDLKTPEGRGYFIHQCNHSEMELNRTKKNQAENALKKAELSMKTGTQAPFGYNNESREVFIDDFLKNECFYSINDKEIYYVGLIYDLYLKYKSLSKVAKILQKTGVKGKNRNLISKSTIKSVLSNPVNVKTNVDIIEYYVNQGFTIGRVEEGKGANTYGKRSNAEFINEDNKKQYFFTLYHEGIIDADKWLEVQNILNKNSRVVPRKGKSNKSALGNLLICKCGAEMIISSIKGEAVYYKCSKECGNKNINGTNVEKMLFNKFIIDSKVLIKDMNKNFDKVFNKLNEHYNKLKIERKNEIINRNKLIEKIIILDSKNEARLRSLNKDAEDRYDRIIQLEEEILSLDKDKSITKKKVKEYISTLKNESITNILLEELDVETRKNILSIVLKEVVWDSNTRTVYLYEN